MDRLTQESIDTALRLLRRGRKAGSRVKINYDEWSEAARSSPIAFLDEFYSNTPYQCRCCGRSFVFAAEDKKVVYEKLKKRLEWHPSLCDGCYSVRVGLERESREFAEAWRIRKSKLRGNAKGIARWREVLEALPRYGVKRDSAKVAQLTSILSRLQGTP